MAGRERDCPDRLSGGQQQRVAIVRAPLTKPRAPLLDEVASALDVELVGEVLAIISELKEDGMTMPIATHEMAFARANADEACDLEAGRIVERGAPARIFSDPQEASTRRFLRAPAGGRAPVGGRRRRLSSAAGGPAARAGRISRRSSSRARTWWPTAASARSCCD